MIGRLFFLERFMRVVQDMACFLLEASRGLFVFVSLYLAFIIPRHKTMCRAEKKCRVTVLKRKDVCTNHHSKIDVSKGGVTCM
jgi:hypothetical protein